MHEQADTPLDDDDLTYVAARLDESGYADYAATIRKAIAEIERLRGIVAEYRDALDYVAEESCGCHEGPEDGPREYCGSCVAKMTLAEAAQAGEDGE